MVYRQWRLFGFLIITLCSSIVCGQEIKVLGLFGDRAFIKVDEKSAVIRVGQSHQNVQLKSITQQKAVLIIDTKEVALALGEVFQAQPEPTQNNVAKPNVEQSTPVSNKAKVQIFANHHNQYLVGGMINSRMVDFLVDTGANTVSMNRKDAQRLGIDFRMTGKVGQSMTANGVVKNWRVVLPKVSVGSIHLAYVEATIRDTEDELPMLLGMSFLRRVKIEQSAVGMTLTER